MGGYFNMKDFNDIINNLMELGDNLASTSEQTYNEDACSDRIAMRDAVEISTIDSEAFALCKTEAGQILGLLTHLCTTINESHTLKNILDLVDKACVNISLPDFVKLCVIHRSQDVTGIQLMPKVDPVTLNTDNHKLALIAGHPTYRALNGDSLRWVLTDDGKWFPICSESPVPGGPRLYYGMMPAESIVTVWPAFRDELINLLTVSLNGGAHHVTAFDVIHSNILAAKAKTLVNADVMANIRRTDAERTVKQEIITRLLRNYSKEMTSLMCNVNSAVEAGHSAYSVERMASHISYDYPSDNGDIMIYPNIKDGRIDALKIRYRTAAKATIRFCLDGHVDVDTHNHTDFLALASPVFDCLESYLGEYLEGITL